MITKDELSARRAMFEGQIKDYGGVSMVRYAKEFLTKVLLPGVPVLSTEVIRLANEERISTPTLRRARTKLRISCYKDWGRGGRWYWMMVDGPPVIN